MDEMSKNMSFEYGDEPKFREGECGHVYFKEGVDESTELFAKNVKLEAHTEYTAHKNARAEAPAVTIDISKTLFDKEESAKTRRVLFEGELTIDDAGSIAPIASLPSIANWPFDNTFIIVTIDGNEYEIPKSDTAPMDGYTMASYGGMHIDDSVPSFANYPCIVIAYDPEQDFGTGLSRGIFMTENSGTYNVKIEVEE